MTWLRSFACAIAVQLLAASALAQGTAPETPSGAGAPPAADSVASAEVPSTVPHATTPPSIEVSTPTLDAPAQPPVVEPPAPAPPVATPVEPDPLPFNYRASIFSRGDVRDGYGGVGLKDSDSVRYRTRFGLVSRPLDLGSVDLVVKFLPQAAGIWNVGGDTLEDPSLGLHEGSLRLLFGETDLEVGRFEMVYGEHFIIGNVDWHEAGRAFDGLRLHQALGGGAWIDGFAALVDEGGGTAIGKSDVYFLGAYAGLGELLATRLALDVYLLGQFRPEQAPATKPRLARGTLGTRVKHRVAAVDLRFEAGVQLGVEGAADLLAYQSDLEVGVNLFDDRLRVALEGLVASGDDPSTTGTNEGWNQLYPTAHKWLGLSDIIGARTNVASGVLHAQAKPHEDWHLVWDGHLFARVRNGALASGVAVDSGLAAFESNVGVQYAIAKGLGVRTLYATFVPVRDHFGTKDTAHFWELELRFDH